METLEAISIAVTQHGLQLDAGDLHSNKAHPHLIEMVTS